MVLTLIFGGGGAGASDVFPVVPKEPEGKAEQSSVPRPFFSTVVAGQCGRIRLRVSAMPAGGIFWRPHAQYGVNWERVQIAGCGGDDLSREYDETTTYQHLICGVIIFLAPLRVRAKRVLTVPKLVLAWSCCNWQRLLAEVEGDSVHLVAR